MSQLEARSAFARMADEELAAREKQAALSAYVSTREITERWGLTPAQLLLEAAEAVRRGEIVVTALEVEKAAA